jgi:butyrate kinase
MNKEYCLLAINVGSTSTKIAFFRETHAVVSETIRYSSEELARYAGLRDQLSLRTDDLLQFLEKNKINLQEIDILISRGGLGKPGPAGAYKIDAPMCEDLLEGKYGKHPSALGPAMVRDIAGKYNKPAIIIDPPSTDEFQPSARISGLPEL